MYHILKIFSKITQSSETCKSETSPKLRPYYSSSTARLVLYESLEYLLLRSCAPKCLKMLPERPGDRRKSSKIKISENFKKCKNFAGQIPSHKYVYQDRYWFRSDRHDILEQGKIPIFKTYSNKCTTF